MFHDELKARTTRTPQRRRRAAKRRRTAEDFVEKAMALLEEHGSQAVTARRLAKEMKLSQMALYRHFETMDHLMAVVWNRGFGQLAEFVEAADEKAGQGLEGFRESLKAYARFGVEHPWLYRFLFAPGPRPEVYGLPSNGLLSLHRLQHRLIELKRDGYVAGEDDLAAVALHLWFLHHGLTTLAISGQVPKVVNVELDRLIESTSDHALRRYGVEVQGQVETPLPSSGVPGGGGQDL
jgi:AcrR family transcriptional regulator